MSSRKTFNVSDFVAKTNEILAVSICEPGIRRGWISALETILHDTGNYRGFRYLMLSEVPAGQKPGIRYGSNGEMLPYEDRFTDVDETRRQFI